MTNEPANLAFARLPRHRRHAGVARQRLGARIARAVVADLGHQPRRDRYALVAVLEAESPEQAREAAGSLLGGLGRGECARPGAEEMRRIGARTTDMLDKASSPTSPPILLSL